MSAKTFGPAIQKRLWVGLLMVMALVFLLTAMRYLQPEPKVDLPKLGLMTTLPLQWSEGGIEAAIASDARPHPAYARLAKAYQIEPIDDLTTLNNDRLSVLLLAQPRAFSPQELVAFDAWVRRGGRVLILADPALMWGSLYPLGDKRRPLFTSLLSPLFSHWGVELLLPINDKESMTDIETDGLRVRTQTPGQWQAKDDVAIGACAIASPPIVADCSVGNGRALLIADADFLDSRYWEGRGIRVFTATDEFGNMQWMEALLKALRQGSAARDFVGQ
jgi:hypothetical protein